MGAAAQFGRGESVETPLLAGLTRHLFDIAADFVGCDQRWRNEHGDAFIGHDTTPIFSE